MEQVGEGGTRANYSLFRLSQRSACCGVVCEARKAKLLSLLMDTDHHISDKFDGLSTMGIETLKFSMLSLPFRSSLSLMLRSISAISDGLVKA